MLIFTFSLTQAQVNWKKTISEKSKISFSLPNKPNIKTQEVNGIQSEIFSYRDAHTIFGIVASDFSAQKFNFSNSDYTEFYQQMKQSSLNDKCKLVVENSIPYQHLLGKEIIYTELVGKKEYTFYKRFFFRNHFIYQIVIGGPSRFKQVVIDKKRLFFNSVTFL